MNADFKQKVNDLIENIFDDDDFVNDVVDSNNISEFMKFFAQYRDKVVDSSGQEAFCYAVFKILQDNFSLEDLRKNSDIVPPGYYFAYCIEKNVKDINLVDWKGGWSGWDHYFDNHFSFWYGYSDLKNIQLDRLTVNDDVLLYNLINALFNAKSGLDSGHINTLVIVDDVGNLIQFNFPGSKDFTIDNVILDNSSNIDVSGLNIKTLSLSNTVIPVLRWNKLDYIDITEVDSDNSGVIVLPPKFISMLLNSDTKILLNHDQKLRVQKIFTAKIKERLQYK